MYRLLIVFIFIIMPTAFGQNIVGEWDVYTSSLYIRDLIARESFIYSASSGGLIQFDMDSERFRTFGINSGLTRMDIECIGEDEFGNFWLGMSSPDGEINIWDTELMAVKQVIGENVLGEKLTCISDFAFYKNYAFAACQKNVDLGVLYFKIKESAYIYQDFSFNFPLDFSSINSLDVVGDTLWMCTSSGLLYTELDAVDIKKDNWKIVDFPDQDYVSNVIQYDGMIIANFGSNIYEIRGDQTFSFNSKLSRKINSISEDIEGNLLVSTTQGVYRLQDNGTWLPLGGGNISVTVSDIAGNLWGGTSGSGLWNYEDNGYSYFTPNTIVDNINTTLFIDENANLVAATTKGISFLTEEGWYNIWKSAKEQKIDDDHSDDNWNYFVADTIPYQVGRIYTILKRSDDTYFASLYGSHISLGGGGLLRFNLNDLERYDVYDTTGGVLAASEGVGSGTADYVAVGYMALDKSDNLWMCNQYAQNGNVVAVLTFDDKWHHFSIDDSHDRLSYYLTSIEFDSDGRVWFGSETHTGAQPSNGGLIVLDYKGSLEDKTDDKWIRVHEGDGLGDNSVYSIVFDHNGDLWIMTAAGIQRAVVSPDFPNRIFDRIEPPVLTSIPFAKECRIKVDGMNNKWIGTVNSGVKVYTYNGIWLNNVEGFTTNNSGLLNNTILDIAFYSPEGLVYLATNKGISVYKSPYAVYGNEYRELVVFPSPYKIPAPEPLVIDGLLQDSEIKIVTLDGTLIRHLTKKNGMILGSQGFWDGKNRNGGYVSSGVYICLAYTKEGDTTIGKIAVVRQ